MSNTKKALLFYTIKNITLSIFFVILYFSILVFLEEPINVLYVPWVFYIIFLNFEYSTILPIVSYLFIILNIYFLYVIFVKKREYKVEDIPKYLPKVSYITLSIIMLFQILLFERYDYLGDYSANEYSVQATSYFYLSSGTLFLNMFMYIIILIKNKAIDMFNNICFLILNILNIFSLSNAFRFLFNYIKFYGTTEKRSQGMIIIYIDIAIITVFTVVVLINLFRNILKFFDK